MSDRQIEDSAHHDDPSGGSFDLGEATRLAWRTVTAAPLQWCSATVVLVVAAVAMNVVGGVVQSALVGTSLLASMAVGLVVSAVVGAVAYLVVAAMVHGALQVLEGHDRFSFTSALDEVPKERVLVLGFVVTLATAVGSVLLVLPGLVLAILTSFALPALVDRRLSVGGAVRRSVELVMANLKEALVITIVAALIAFAGVVACLVGIVVSMPVAVIVLTQGYVALDGKRS